ncbi:MAG: carbamoyl phosphate synthase large subunit, partial [Verrucomicrobia bacterium]|nr:carbamoyl phosphate synthase large subunit [Verrucomicrobiota bacterium]
DKQAVGRMAKGLCDRGFTLFATTGTNAVLSGNGIPSETVRKISEGSPNVLDMMEAGDIHWIVNTPSSTTSARVDEVKMRAGAVRRGIPITTTIDGLRAALNGLEAQQPSAGDDVRCLQEYHPAPYRVPANVAAKGAGVNA